MSIYRRKRQESVTTSLTGNDSGTKYIGVTLPFNNPAGVFFQSTTNRVQILSNVRNLLLTAKGERYMSPTFGTNLRAILFENITDEDTFITSLKNEIISAFTEWMPFLTVENLTIKLDLTEDGRVSEPDHAVSIKFSVNIIGTTIYLPIKIFISETGGLSIQEAIYNELFGTQGY